MSAGKYQAYPKYTESNIAWLRKVPVHWSPLRFKHALFEKPKTSNSELDAGSISFGEVIYKNTETISAETKNSYQEVLPGEFLVNPLNLNFDLKSLRTALSSIAVVVSTGYIVLKSSDRLVKRYVRWLLQEFDVAHMKTLGSGVRQTINYTDIGNSFFYEPSPDEQTQIAKFLDYETAKIDALIAKQQQLIALLQEKRQAVISHAVTKGLNPAAPLRDSGVAWLGKVPAHWEEYPLKALFGLKHGYAFDSTEFSDSGEFILMTPGNFNECGGFRHKIPEKFYTGTDIPKDFILKSGQLLVAMTEQGPGLLGCALFVPEQGTYLHNQRLGLVHKIGRDKVSVQYLFHLFNSSRYRAEVSVSSTGAKVQHTSPTKILSIKIWLPPLSEQELIARFIDERIAKVDTLEVKAKQAVELLQERRIALISAAVTGKIDVRGWQPPLANAAGTHGSG